MRREGKIHWDLHPSKDPKWFNTKGKNPGDIVQANPVRQKSWMSTPGHPFTHKYTGKPRDPSDFWDIRPKPFPGAHFAVYPETLCIAPIKSSCPMGGVVLDPFAGSGTTMKVAIELGRSAIGIELNASYAEIVQKRVQHLKVYPRLAA
jgi:DNA modification methylase